MRQDRVNRLRGVWLGHKNPIDAARPLGHNDFHNRRRYRSKEVTPGAPPARRHTPILGPVEITQTRNLVVEIGPPAQSNPAGVD